MRINFLGGPGSGKSTTAARVFSELKERHYSAESVSEYVKAWAYSGRSVKDFDQIYVFAKQQQYEFKWLSHGVKNIITDSPTFLSVFYSNKYLNKDLANCIWELCKLYDSKFPAYYIFLDRGNKVYDPNGRYQTEDQAKTIDTELWEALVKYYPAEMYCKIPFQDKEQILQKVLELADK